MDAKMRTNRMKMRTNKMLNLVQQTGPGRDKNGTGRRDEFEGLVGLSDEGICVYG